MTATDSPFGYLLVHFIEDPDGYAEKMAEGMVLADGAQCLPAKAAPVEGTDREALICLHEGKYHQVRADVCGGWKSCGRAGEDRHGRTGNAPGSGNWHVLCAV